MNAKPHCRLLGADSRGFGFANFSRYNPTCETYGAARLSQTLSDSRKSMDVFEKLPNKLKYLVEPAKKYGAFETEDELDAFLENITPQLREELEKILAKFVNEEHQVDFDAFLDEYSICEYEQSCQLEMLFQTIEFAGIYVEGPEWNTVEKHMEALSRFGSFRLASERMHAAKFLADFGEDASTAISLLQNSLKDEDHRVRVWSSYALFCINNNSENYVSNIEAYLSDADSEVRTEAASALGSIGERASRAVPKLVSLIENPGEDKYVAGIYMESLVKIDKSSPTVLGTLLKARRSNVEEIRECAKELLDELGVENRD